LTRAWINRQQNDTYVKRAREDGYRARAAYKLLELDDKDQLFAGSRIVVDLGAAPGSWCQVAQRALGEQGRVIALDILPMEELPGVTFIQGDFRENEVLVSLEDEMRGQKADLVLSDMAPNLSGIAASDQARSVDLAELALAFARDWLKPSGACAVKVFQGAGFESVLKEFRSAFRTVRVRKPQASRSESREVYLVGRRLA
jgi:23S rRNA (uridine2552-2'-O)-methyltransferase